VQSGGWTIHWQGAFSESEFPEGSGLTLLQEMKARGVDAEWLVGVEVWGDDVSSSAVFDK
jgi:hypothetical protein